MSNNNQPNRFVDEDALEFDGDIRCLNGKPFTGSGVDHYKSGSIRSITNYKEGLEDGIIQEWNEDGKLISECHARRGMKYGIEKKWYANGNIKSESEFEWGVELSFVEYDERNKILTKREINKEDPNSNYKILLKFRKAYSDDEN